MSERVLDALRISALLAGLVLVILLIRLISLKNASNEPVVNVPVVTAATSKPSGAIPTPKVPSTLVPTMTPVTPTITPVPTLTPTPAGTSTTVPTPTLTLVPDPDLGFVVNSEIAPVVNAAASFHPAAVAHWLNTHPWTGVLRWTDSGAEIGGRPTRVALATELNFYSLNRDDPDGSVTRFFGVEVRPGTLYIPETKRHFFNHRAEEVLYWMAQFARRQGGELLVAYDSNGQNQAITVIDFRLITEPTPTP